jgi:hypothetical protein
MLDQHIVARPDFLASSTEAMSLIGSLICDAKGVPRSFAVVEYGAFIGDPRVAPATAYGALKNKVELADACLATLGLHCHLKAKKLRAGGLMAFAFKRSKRDDAMLIAQITRHIGPQMDHVVKRIDENQFLADAAEYLRST